MNARNILIVALLLLATLYAFWFARDAHPVAAMLVFALPPTLCAVAVATSRRTAGFWSGVLALAWFSHAVMVAWTRPPERMFAWWALALSLAVVFAASLPGLRARFAKKR
ncbi:DUF2069 domain-containing protein [Pseudoluteimonas lycopersici]|uniref:DUF2069 domain-containing protein n=1 Tax=Pseudoluteimonas lycopersici TaxID=1324796 RepID=A0A516V814_9GAMM|nr:DUF2069 domain-containing protein [Lysobacter lycopersici]QDQ74661.1 DUF2069 domain-containing protein [Lysobacter lycopersici]